MTAAPEEPVEEIDLTDIDPDEIALQHGGHRDNAGPEDAP